MHRRGVLQPIPGDYDAFCQYGTPLPAAGYQTARKVVAAPNQKICRIGVTPVRRKGSFRQQSWGRSSQPAKRHDLPASPTG
jgi:hypothetical protein